MVANLFILIIRGYNVTLMYEHFALESVGFS